jgi:hypothetical protein
MEFVMPLDLTFKKVREFVQKDDPKLMEDIDRLLGIALICSSLVAGPAAIIAIPPIIGVKNELVKIGKGVFEAIAGKKDDDYLARQQRMEIAYGLICFTAFFEALDLQISDELRQKINLREGEKISLAKDAQGKNVYQSKTSSISQDQMIDPSNSLESLAVPFLHPAETLAQQIERNTKLWIQMRDGFLDFVQNLAFWEKAQEWEQIEILSELDNIPQVAAKCFEAQYFVLVRHYEDFAVWAYLQEHKNTRELIGSLSDYVKKQAALAENSKAQIDIGFAGMHDAVLSIPETLKITRAIEIAEDLKCYYDSKIAEPIAKEGESNEDNLNLHFPQISTAFVPQSFKVLRWTNQIRSLEDEATWEGLERRDDLGAFLLSYLSSPYSTEAPLVILGHPGSGKSLLTKVISAQLMSEHYTIIRVPLREVNADAAIMIQTEERIHQITGHLTNWAAFSSAFKNSPPIVILDGYDELLQASGKVFSGYLKDAQSFQNNETVLRRPLRVIVTSRITLIDKAVIPQGATIIRLLEFDKRQRDSWISTWNQENAKYFKEAAIAEFALPEENDNESSKVLSLAEQPLLLLMLALYDSEGNQLKMSRSLDRTILYDSLLRRFVEREKRKDQKFRDLEPSEKIKELDLEMQRLSVAALGMYNRRKLHIISHELNEDIKFFDLERPISVSGGRPMTQADLLLGSFFFVHKSKAQVKAGASEHYEESAAFEFLHNTFGEFLTAEFIIRQAMVEVAAVKRLKENDDLRLDFEKRLNDADGLLKSWFASLVYTPLFTRPVVLEMMREWIAHALKNKQIEKPEFLSHLDIIIANQIERLLSKRKMPSIIRGEAAQEGYRTPFGNHPLLGHIAIYSINLILLRIVVADKPFDFKEELIGTYEDGTRPWDRLTHIWRSWFSLDNLNGVTAVMIADRQDSKIEVQAKGKFQVAESQDRLETCLKVAISLGDNISSGIAGLLLFEPLKDNQLDIEDIARRLESEKFNLELQIAMKRIFQNEAHINSDNALKFSEAFEKALWMALKGNKRLELELIILSLRRVMKRMSFGRFGKVPIDANYEKSKDFLQKVINPRMASDVAIMSPQAALVLIQLAEELHDLEWINNFTRQLPLHELDLGYLLDLSRRNPEAALAWVQLMKECGGERFLRYTNPKSFERALDSRYLLELSELNPEAALAWVQLMKELGGERFLLHIDPEFFERALEPRYLLDLSERNPEAVLAWLQLMKESGGARFLRHIDPEFFERALEPGRLMKGTTFAVLLQLARIRESSRATDLVLRYLISLMNHRIGRGFSLEMLPLTAIRDLQWLAKTTANPEINSVLNSLLDETTS